MGRLWLHNEMNPIKEGVFQEMKRLYLSIETDKSKKDSSNV